MCASLITCISGCKNSNGNEEEKTVSSSQKKDYDIFIYNSDVDISSSFKKMCEDYTSRTGVIIRVVTPHEDDNNFENLASYLNSEFPPDIFTVNNISELTKLKNNSQIWDFSNATEESFKKIANEIPESLRLSSNTTDSFGIPYTTEAYGLLVDPKMISSLFGGDKHRKVLNDLKEASYEEFLNFVEALKLYISGNSLYEFSLNGKSYSFVPSKGELSKNLNGVFSVPAGDYKYTGTYLTNIALSSVFKSPAAANIATDDEINNLKHPLSLFAQTLDMITLNISGSVGPLGRGIELVSSTQNSVSQAMKNFVNGKSVFLLASTKDYDNLSIFDSLIAKRCIFMPIKMPFEKENVTSSPDISKNIHRSIPIYCPKYYCINAKSPETEKKSAQDFLTWLQTSDLAKKYIISEFGFTPYNTKEPSVIDNPFSRSMLEYISENHTLPGVFQGVPETWCENIMGKYLVEQFLSKANWGQSDYEKIAEHGIAKWKELVTAK